MSIFKNSFVSAVDPDFTVLVIKYICSNEALALTGRYSI